MANITHHNIGSPVPARRVSEVIDWASDRAAEVAQELGFAPEDLAGMVGTGQDGSITVADVKNWGKEA